MSPLRFTSFLSATMLIAALLFSTGCGTKEQNDTEKATPQLQPAALQPSPSASPTEVPIDSAALERITKERWTGDLDEIADRRYLRALVLLNKTDYFYDGGQARGIIYESLKELEKFLNQEVNTGTTPVHFVFIPVRREDLIKGLLDGRGDVAASNIAITHEREKLVAFSDPLRSDGKQLVVTGPGAPNISSIEDLAGKEVYVRKSSRYWESLTALNSRLTEAGKPRVILKAADENLDDEDILNMVNAGLIPITITADLIAKFWSQILDSIKVHEELAVSTGDRIAWAVNPKSPKLLEVVNKFVKDHKIGTSFGNTLLQRYLKNTSWAKNNTSPAEMEKFKATIQFFKKYSGQYGFDWLLVAAQAFQESQIDQSRKSSVGAVGIMQIKPSTAADKNIGVTGVEVSAERNIEAGVKYLRFIVDEYFKNEPMDRINKGLFAAASYNAGPARVAKLRKQAQAEGLDPNKWFNNVELVAAKEIGRETVTYVGNIYKYYVAYKLSSEQAAKKKRAT